MNVFWIICVWYGRDFCLEAQAGVINFAEFRKALGFMAGFTSLCGLAHWILCMNYFTLAIKIKFLKDQRSFAKMQVSLKVFYYLIAMVNVTVPIIGVVYWDSIFQFWIMIIVCFVWMFTALILGLALVIIK